MVLDTLDPANTQSLLKLKETKRTKKSLIQDYIAEVISNRI